MKSIVYIVLYFGKFPSIFPLWLNSCRNNPTIDWLIFTDDHSCFNYPQNVRVEYTTFENIQARFKKHFDYPVVLHKPYKLCDYRICYGAVFQDFIKNYDFWGFCDIDLLWGNIRTFITEGILNKYDKIGFQGHSTLVRNIDFYNRMYTLSVDGKSFKDFASTEKNGFVDEMFFNKLFISRGIPFYDKIVFANLSSLMPNFKITYLLPEEENKNKRFIFVYEDESLYRMSVANGKIYKDEFMYVHFLRRDMEICISANSKKFIIIPNKLIPYTTITRQFIIKASRPHWIKFILLHFIENAYKLNYKTVIPVLITKVKGYSKLFFNNKKKQYE